jgi:hypothetical protein
VRWSDWLAVNCHMANSPVSNYGNGGYTARVFTALALANINPNGPRLLADVLAYRQARVLPMLTNPTSSVYGGFWEEGWNYGALSARNLVLDGLALEEAGAIPAATAERHWSTQVIDDLVRAQSSPNTVYDAGDWYAYPAPFPGKDLFDVLGAAADDPAAQSYANYVIQNYHDGPNTANSIDLLYRNPSAPAAFWGPCRCRTSPAARAC